MSKQMISTRDYSVLNIRLSKLMREKDLTLSSLAQQASVAIGTIQKLATDPKCNPTIASLEAISKVLNTSISYLIGHDDKPVPQKIKNIPVLIWENLPENFSQKTLHISESGETIRTISNVSDNAFALRVMGQATLPLFPEKTLLIFDPNKKYRDGSFVLAKLKELDKVVFKQLIVDEPNIYLKSINPSLNNNEMITLTKDDFIFATLIQSQMDY